MMEGGPLAVATRAGPHPALRYLAVVLTGIAGIAIGSMKGIIVGTYVGDFGLTPANAGYLLSTVMTATTVGTVLAAVVAPRWVLALALGVIFVGNLGTATLATPTTIFAWQALAGLGHGFAIGRMAKAIAAVENPHRLSGLYLASTLILSAACAYFLSNLQAVLGPHALFLMISLTGLSGLAGLRWMPAPHEARAAQTSSGDPSAVGRGATVLMFVALLCYYTSIGGFWPFLTRIGTMIGLANATRLHVLGLAIFVSLFGASFSILFGERLGKLRPLIVFFTLQAAAIALLILGARGLTTFTASAWLYDFAWQGGFPFLLGLLSKIDRSARLNAIAYITAFAGYALGPAGSGLLIKAASTEARGLIWVEMAGLGLHLIGAVSILGLAWALLRRNATIASPRISAWA